jgi:hypothetical protein
VLSTSPPHSWTPPFRARLASAARRLPFPSMCSILDTRKLRLCIPHPSSLIPQRSGGYGGPTTVDEVDAIDGRLPPNGPNRAAIASVLEVTTARASPRLPGRGFCTGVMLPSRVQPSSQHKTSITSGYIVQGITLHNQSTASHHHRALPRRSRGIMLNRTESDLHPSPGRGQCLIR